MICFSLPFPVGVNNMFPTGKAGNRFPSKAYRAWKAEALASLWEAFGAHPPSVSGPFWIRLELDRRDRRMTDLDGRIKAVLDHMKNAKMIDDDSLAEEINIKWTSPLRDASYHGKQARIYVEFGAYE